MYTSQEQQKRKDSNKSTTYECEALPSAQGHVYSAREALLEQIRKLFLLPSENHVHRPSPLPLSSTQLSFPTDIKQEREHLLPGRLPPAQGRISAERAGGRAVCTVSTHLVDLCLVSIFVPHINHYLISLKKFHKIQNFCLANQMREVVGTQFEFEFINKYFFINLLKQCFGFGTSHWLYIHMDIYTYMYGQIYVQAYKCKHTLRKTKTSAWTRTGPDHTPGRTRRPLDRPGCRPPGTVSAGVQCCLGWQQAGGRRPWASLPRWDLRLPPFPQEGEWTSSWSYTFITLLVYYTTLSFSVSSSDHIFILLCPQSSPAPERSTETGNGPSIGSKVEHSISGLLVQLLQ